MADAFSRGGWPSRSAASGVARVRLRRRAPPRRTFAVTVRGKESGVAHIAVGKLPWGVTIR
jgi:hypothetical protein